jgi:NCS1 family nucleobase:cation symporter-1
VGQTLGLPLTITAFSFIGIAVTAATVVVFGEATWDPVVLVARIAGPLPAVLIITMIVIAIAQISTNIPANVVSPSNDFSNLAPKYISFRSGGLITAVLGVVSFPWVLFNNVGAYILIWLVGHGSLLGAIGAVMIMDYWIVRRRRLDLIDLYETEDRCTYSGGWNWRAIVAVLVGVAPVIPGFLRATTTPNFSGVFEISTFIDTLYTYGLYFTFFATGIAYLLMSLLPGRTLVVSEERRVSV